MSSDDQATAAISNGSHCRVTAGVHAGQSGTVRDRHTSKTGHVTITVEQANGICFKTLDRNVVADNSAR